jgi:predicted secreted protein
MNSHVLTLEDHNTQHQIRVGDELLVELPALPGAGFRWSEEAPSASILQHQSTTYTPQTEHQTTPQTEHQTSTAIGAATLQRFAYHAAIPGTVELKFRYWRSWQGAGSIEKRFRTVIVVI